MFEKLFDSRKNNTFLVLNWNSNSYINLIMFASLVEVKIFSSESESKAVISELASVAEII